MCVCVSTWTDIKEITATVSKTDTGFVTVAVGYIWLSNTHARRAAVSVPSINTRPFNWSKETELVPSIRNIICMYIKLCSE